MEFHYLALPLLTLPRRYRWSAYLRPCLFRTWPPAPLHLASLGTDIHTPFDQVLILYRYLGGAIGISLGQAIFSNVARKRMSRFPGLDLDTSAEALGQIVPKLKLISVSDSTCFLHILKRRKDITTRMSVMQAISTSVSMIWLVNTPFIGVCFVLGALIDKWALVAYADDRPEVLFIRKYTLKRPTVRQGDDTSPWRERYLYIVNILLHA